MGAYEMTSETPIKRKVSIMTFCVIGGGILIHLSLGSFFTFGNMAPYMISYLRNRTDDTTVRNIDGLWVLSIGSFGNCFGMTLGGIINRKLGPRTTAALGCFIFSAATAVNYFCLKVGYWAVILCYGFISNFGSLMAYGITVQVAIQWLPHRPTLATGFIVSGFGGGSLIFNQVITAFINPDNLSPDLETPDGDRYFTDADLLDRVPVCFLLLGGIYVVMQVIGLIFITNPPETDVVVGVGMTNTGYAESNGIIDKTIAVNGYNGVTDIATITNSKDINQKEIEMENKLNNEKINVKDVLKQSLTSRSFYIVWLTVMAIVAGVNFITGLYKAYGQTFIHDDHFFATVGTVSSIFNCLGRPLWGMVMDRFGYRFTIRIISIGLAVTSGTLIFTEKIHKLFFMLWICVGYFFFCGTWAVCPSTLSKLFGVKNMATNYGFINVALGVASFITGIFGVTLKDTIGWNGLNFMSSGVLVIPFLLSFLFNGIDSRGKRI